MNLRAKKIVIDAWHITNTHKQLLKYGFISSLLGIVVGGVYVFYQINAFKNSKLFQEQENFGLYTNLVTFAKNHPQFFFWFLLVAIITFFCYMFVPMICQATITHLVAKIYKGEKPEHGLSTALFRFLPLLETFAVKATVKPQTFFTEWSFVIRNLGPGVAKLLMPVFIIGLFIGVLALFLLIFTTPLVVIKKENFSQSVRDSGKLVIRNLGTTFSLFLIFLLIELRVLLNVAVILFLPVAILAITGLFATLVLKTIGIFVAVFVGIILISLTAFITGTLEVFSTAIWTIAFVEFAKNEEKLE